MDNSKQRVLVLTALVLIIITMSAIYKYQTDPQIQENIKLLSIKQKLNAPTNAEFLGIKQYQLLEQSITVYTWRQKDTLYEAQLDDQDNIIKTTTYQHNTNETIKMTPYLAETLAQQKLITETQYPPGHPNLSDPTFEYISFRPKGPYWVVKWGLHSGNYSISNIDFKVIVYTETGETEVDYNEFNEVTMIPEFTSPKIGSDEAKQLAANYFKESMEYAVVESIKNHGVHISPPNDFFIRPPYRLYWSVSVAGMGLEKGVPTSRKPVFYIDAYTGELLSSVYLSVGWDTINWKNRPHPYYGSVYPRIIDKTPHDYDFPLSIEEVKEQLSNHSSLYRDSANSSFQIGVYDETSISNGLSWDMIILGTYEDKSVISSYWTNSYNWIKTGLINPPNSIKSLINADDLIDGVFIIVDPVTDELILYHSSTRIDPPSNTLNITREQAINIAASSPLTDPENKIITPNSLILAEPRVIKPNWISQLAHVGDFRRLYVANENQTEPRIYWIIKYSMYPEMHVGGYSGTYLVDAENGQIALIIEDYPLPDLIFRAYAPDRVTLRKGEDVSFNITVKAASTLEAQFPVTVTADQIPDGVTVVIQRDTLQLSNNKTATFNVILRASSEAETGIYFTTFEVRLLGKGTSAHFDLIIME